MEFLEFHEKAAVEIVRREVKTLREREHVAILSGHVTGVDAVLAIELDAGEVVKVSEVKGHAHGTIGAKCAAKFGGLVVVAKFREGPGQPSALSVGHEQLAVKQVHAVDGAKGVGKCEKSELLAWSERLVYATGKMAITLRYKYSRAGANAEFADRTLPALPLVLKNNGGVLALGVVVVEGGFEIAVGIAQIARVVNADVKRGGALLLALFDFVVIGFVFADFDQTFFGKRMFNRRLVLVLAPVKNLFAAAAGGSVVCGGVIFTLAVGGRGVLRGRFGA